MHHDQIDQRFGWTRSKVGRFTFFGRQAPAVLPKIELHGESGWGVSRACQKPLSNALASNSGRAVLAPCRPLACEHRIVGKLAWGWVLKRWVMQTPNDPTHQTLRGGVV